MSVREREEVQGVSWQGLKIGRGLDGAFGTESNGKEVCRIGLEDLKTT